MQRTNHNTSSTFQCLWLPPPPSICWFILPLLFRSSAPHAVRAVEVVTGRGHIYEYVICLALIYPLCLYKSRKVHANDAVFLLFEDICMCMYVEYMQKCSAVSDLEHLSGNSRNKYRRSPAYFSCFCVGPRDWFLFLVILYFVVACTSYSVAAFYHLCLPTLSYTVSGSVGPIDWQPPLSSPSVLHPHFFLAISSSAMVVVHSLLFVIFALDGSSTWNGRMTCLTMNKNKQTQTLQLEEEEKWE